jgi:hypothetical protein
MRPLIQISTQPFLGGHWLKAHSDKKTCQRTSDNRSFFSLILIWIRTNLHALFFVRHYRIFKRMNHYGHKEKEDGEAAKSRADCNKRADR